MSFSLRSMNTGTAVLVAGIVVHCCMILSLQFGFLNPLFDDSMHRAGQGVDFFSVVQAGHNLIDGMNIYSTKTLEQVVPFFNPFRYHPFVAYSFGLVFSIMRADVAYVLWIFIQEVLLIINLFLTKELFHDSRSAAIAMGLWLLFSPYYLELYMGQFSFLMASLLFWTIIAWMKGNLRGGDTSWIFSLMVKSNSVLLAPVLMKLRRWKTVVVAGLVSMLLALPYFLIMPGSLSDFSRNINQGMTAPTIFGNQGFSAMIAVFVLRSAGVWSDFVQEFAPRIEQMNEMLVIPLAAWTVLVVGFTIVVTFRASKDHSVPMFLLWILAYFLFYKHVWEHQYVMLVPVFVLLYHQMYMGKLIIPRILFWTVFAVIALPTLFVFIDYSPVLFDPEIPWRTWESIVYHAPKPIAILILFGVLASRLWNRAARISHPAPELS